MSISAKIPAGHWPIQITISYLEIFRQHLPLQTFSTLHSAQKKDRAGRLGVWLRIFVEFRGTFSPSWFLLDTRNNSPHLLENINFLRIVDIIVECRSIQNTAKLCKQRENLIVSRLMVYCYHGHDLVRSASNLRRYSLNMESETPLSSRGSVPTMYWVLITYSIMKLLAAGYYRHTAPSHLMNLRSARDMV